MDKEIVGEDFYLDNLRYFLVAGLCVYSCYRAYRYKPFSCGLSVLYFIESILNLLSSAQGNSQ